jgi:hypothetical protein
MQPINIHTAESVFTSIPRTPLPHTSSHCSVESILLPSQPALRRPGSDAIETRRGSLTADARVSSTQQEVIPIVASAYLDAVSFS